MTYRCGYDRFLVCLGWVFLISVVVFIGSGIVAYIRNGV